MDDLSALHKSYYSLLGQINYWIYVTDFRQWLSTPISWFLKRLPLLGIIIGLLMQGPFVLSSSLVLFILINFIYWRVSRGGHIKFLAQKETAVSLPDDQLTTLPYNQKVKLRATGPFSLTAEEANLMLRPAEYWQVPLGEHIVMVERMPERYMYQFFNGRNLQKVEEGWLIFGKEPMAAIAITFRTEWGPEFANFEVRHFIQDKQPSPKSPMRTIYFTFINNEEKTLVCHNIIRDARRVRQ